MERFDDKNSLKGGFFAIYGAYIEPPPPKKKKQKKKVYELFIQALS